MLLHSIGSDGWSYDDDGDDDWNDFFEVKVVGCRSQSSQVGGAMGERG